MVLDALAGFAANRTTSDQVMRAMVAYDGWWAPARLADGPAELCCTGAPSALPAERLWLFTSREAVLGAHVRTTLGPYAGPLRGTPLFAALPAAVRLVSINVAQPTIQTWQFADGAVEVARRYARALALERMLACKADALGDALLAFEFMLLAMAETDHVMTAPKFAGMYEPVLAFTTPDAVALAVASALGPAPVRTKLVRGSELFPALAASHNDGLMLNIAGPHGTSHPIRHQTVAALAALASMRRASASTLIVTRRA